MKIHYTTKGLDLTPELEKYVHRKLARLIKKVPRKLRAEAICQIDFLVVRKKGTEFKTCTMTFRFDDIELKAAETTLHMYAALDIAAVHLERQLIDYVAKQGHHVRARLKRYLKKDWQ